MAPSNFTPIWRVVSVLAISLILGACGSSAPETIAFSDADEVAAEDAAASGATIFLEGDVDMVEFHARWVCELQRRTFPELSGVDNALAENLAGNGLDQADYDGFLEELAASQELRDAVLERYTATCLG